MVAASAQDTVIRCQVQSVEFGFYGDQDVRDRSVIEITSSMAFDPTGNSPLPHGLYDVHMGPTRFSDPPCITCALDFTSCPGHFGHVELAVPVHHPLLLPELLTILRIKCLACHRLKCAARQLNIYRTKFFFLYQHDVEMVVDGLEREITAALIQSRGGTGDDTVVSSSKSNKASAQAANLAVDSVLRKYQQQMQQQQQQQSNSTSSTSRKKKQYLNSYEQQWRRQLIAECISACKAAKRCHHCGAVSPKIRQDSSNKIFQTVLGARDARSNHNEGIVIESALAAVHENDDDDNDNDMNRSSRKKKNSNQGGYDSDDTVTNTPPVAKSRQDGVGGDSDDGEEGDDDNGKGNGKDDAFDDDDEVGTNNKRDRFMHTLEVQAQLKRTWQRDAFLMNCLFGAGPHEQALSGKSENGYQRFFMQAIPVPPNRFRPAMQLGGMAVEHGQTQYLSKMMQHNEQVRTHFAAAAATANKDGNNNNTNNANVGEPRAYAAWIELQTTVNCFMDASKDPSATPIQLLAPGIRQILERKEGLFRKNMMGKRVDYACRSVISPDPYIGTNEIGLPRYFATVLTYPTPVTDWNIREMRQLVERGPNNYPGARWVEVPITTASSSSSSSSAMSSLSPSIHQPTSRRVDLSKMNKHKRESVAAQLLTHLKSAGGKPCIVGRQLRDGDYVLMNRQPTLHKPGIMAHRVRILHNPTQKTIRMHYANCNTYNADFDGDEMNCHYPQNDIARAEAQYIAKTDLQYIVPTDGSPLRGLIQDHVVGGVKLTKKDTFLEKWEYQQLLFACLASLPGLEIIRSDMEIKLLPPAVLKPRELWTGKQVITTLMLHLRLGNDQDTPEKSNFPGISMEFKSKTPENAFGAQQMEHRVLFIDGELIRGVLDKSAFGAANFSLVHAVYEAYGPEKAGLFLNALSRLFTAYIQYFAGHSCRTEDLMLTKAADDKRKQLIQRAYNLGARAAKAWADSEGGKVPIAPVTEESNRPLKPVESAAACAKIGELLSGNEGKENFASLDKFMQGQLNPLASDIVKEALPSGLVVAFPFNSFGIMTTTGAKGSIVNQSQVVCSLGQQALEGRRVPRLSSGRTLPSFAPYDPNPRADGFVMDRFLTGVRPQEYYFHCMAGREGLVDTAVKTSRSGYLQRCLMKHMEELLICYDSTVRNAEGSVVQFLYGEDGLDPTKAPFLDCSDRTLEFLARNHESMKRHSSPLPNSTIQIAAADASLCKVLDGKPAETLLQSGSRVLARRLREGTEWKRGAICRGWFEATIKKTHNHGKAFDLEYVDDGYKAKRVPLRADLGNCGGTTTAAASSIAELVKPAAFDPVLASTRGGHRLGSSGACISERVADHAYNAIKNNPDLLRAMSSVNVSARELGKLISAKYSSSLCAPGEAVGSIAAQSIGEPSTQMTLNTFHLAGAGANVTLGIPRLREIIMTASRVLKTPTMSVPLNDTVTDKQAIRLTRKFSKITLIELICGYRGVTVTERLERGEAGNWSRAYYIKIKCHPAERIREAFGLSLHDVARVIAGSFVPKLSQLMKKELKRSAVEGDIGTVEVDGGHSTDYIESKDGKGDDSGPAASVAATRDDLDDDADDDDDDGDAPGDEDGADSSRYRRRSQSVSYDDDDDGDGEAQSAKPASPSAVEEQEEEDADEAATSAMFNKKDGLHVNERANTISLQSLRVDPSARPLLMVGLVESAAATTVVRARKNINQAFINEEENGRGRCFQTAGMNFEEIWKLDNVDHNRLMSNDIWAMRNAYGVEAAAASIKEQITSVFGAYGIEVDPRHLSLIADYMTFDGGFKAMNRTGMEGSSSPFLQMSFETTAQFLRQAAIANDHDILSSPSGNIVMGRPIRHGTGSFTLLAK